VPEGGAAGRALSPQHELPISTGIFPFAVATSVAQLQQQAPGPSASPAAHMPSLGQAGPSQLAVPSLTAATQESPHGETQFAPQSVYAAAARRLQLSRARQEGGASGPRVPEIVPVGEISEIESRPSKRPRGDRQILRSTSAFAGSSSGAPPGVMESQLHEVFDFRHDIPGRRSLPTLGEDLSGHTAAEAKGMTPEEREKMLYKRRIRNRESAARTREKRKVSLQSIREECDQLTQRMLDLSQRVEDVIEANSRLHSRNQQLESELFRLRGGEDPGHHQRAPQHRVLQVQEEQHEEQHPVEQLSLRETAGLAVEMMQEPGLGQDPHSGSGIAESQAGIGMGSEAEKDEGPEHPSEYTSDRAKRP
jgi:hypothetical protein